MELREDVFFLIKHLSKCLELSLDKEAASLDLTPQQGRLLRFLIIKQNRNEKVRQIDIEERFQLSKSTVSGLVKRMQCKKLIYKKIEKHNIYIYPSEDGIKLMKLFDEKVDVIRNKVMQSLKKEEAESLITNLNKLLIGIKEES